MEKFTVTNSNETKVENPRLRELFDKRKLCKDNEALAAVMNDIAQELVMNARFLSVVRMQAGKDNKAQIAFALLNDGSGKTYYPLFTDVGELTKWKPATEEGSKIMLLEFDNYARMIVEKNGADGIVINPFGDNLIVDKETVSRWWDKKQIIKKGFTQHVIPDGAEASFSVPDPFPMDLSNALCDAAREHKEIRRLWIRQMEQDGQTSFLAVIDGDNLPGSVITAIGSAVKPLLKSYDMQLNIVFAGSDLGKRAVENVMPVYSA